jgi:hypothetical protein
VKEDEDVAGMYEVRVEVVAQGGARPLTGTVTFYLHDTFDQPVQRVKVNKNGVARLVVYAYGAFTVGAVADGGKTLLELDLAEDEGFPEEFREL